MQVAMDTGGGELTISNSGVTSKALELTHWSGRHIPSGADDHLGWLGEKQMRSYASRNAQAAIAMAASLIVVANSTLAEETNKKPDTIKAPDPVRHQLRELQRHTFTPLAQKAFQWLALHQNQDGSWGSNPTNQVALTGLAVLGFSQSGHRPDSEEFGKCVMSAWKKLLAYTDAIQSNSPPPVLETDYVSSEQILAWSVVEACRLTQIPSVRAASYGIIGHIIRPGGKGYSVWRANALRRAYIALPYGLDQFPKLEFQAAQQDRLREGKPAFAVKGIQQVNLNEEQLIAMIRGDTNRTDIASLLAAAIQVTGIQLSEREQAEPDYYERLIDFVHRNARLDWAEHSEEYPLMTWCMCSAAIWKDGGEARSEWFKAAFAEYQKRQEDDGHWKEPVTKNGHGQREKDLWGEDADIYATCIILLSFPACVPLPYPPTLSTHCPDCPPPPQYPE